MKTTLSERMKYELKSPFYSFLVIVILMFALMSIFLSGCRTTKDVSRHEKETNEQEKSSATVSESQKRTIQRNIVEKLPGSVLVPEKNMSGILPFASVMEGKEVVIENEGQKAVLSYDKLTGGVKFDFTTKPTSIPVVGEKVTNETITEDIKRDSTGSKEKASHQKQSDMERHVKRTDYTVPVILIINVLVLTGGYFLRKKIPYIKYFFK